MREELSSLCNFIRNAERDKLALGFAGNLYEPIAIQALLYGGTFQVKNLKDPRQTFALHIDPWDKVDVVERKMEQLNIGEESALEVRAPAVEEQEADNRPSKKRVRISTNTLANLPPTDNGGDAQSMDTDQSAVGVGESKQAPKVADEKETADDKLAAAWKLLIADYAKRNIDVEIEAELLCSPSPSILLYGAEELKNLEPGAPRIPANGQFEAFDFFRGPKDACQITVSPSHLLSYAGVQSVLKHMDASKEKPCRFFTVCPSFIYHNLKSPRAYHFKPSEVCVHRKKGGSKQSFQCQACAQGDPLAEQYALLCDPWEMIPQSKTANRCILL